ncbi:unnamed protein product [Parnassius mnemosyne]|uniref:Uncharacterized protein n=1 Tax=Parnassius mnemosyne TaxID=213953 RepID=A0AAV1KS86_9NEOP
MAGANEIQNELLIPLFSEREDSGIDSDDADREGRVRRGHGDELTETSSSDEDLVVKPPCARPADINNFVSTFLFCLNLIYVHSRS